MTPTEQEMSAVFEAHLKGGTVADRPNRYKQQILDDNPELADNWEDHIWIRVNGETFAPLDPTTAPLEAMELLNAADYSIDFNNYDYTEPWGCEIYHGATGFATIEVGKTLTEAITTAWRTAAKEHWEGLKK